MSLYSKFCLSAVLLCLTPFAPWLLIFIVLWWIANWKELNGS